MWDEIAGQERAKRILQTHLAEATVAQAYLLAGPDGVGKRRLALEMATALICDADTPRPCGACLHCRQVGRGVHPDLHVIVPGGSADQIRIDDIRHLLGRLALKPFNAAVQVAVLEHAERLNEEAANCLLKTLEEPARSTRFLLTTARLSQCLPTVVSRCQLIRCEPLPPEVISRLLIAQQACEAAVAAAVARLCGGSMARALELAGRWDSHERIVGQLADVSSRAWLSQPLPETREEAIELLDGLMAWLRDLAVAAVADPVLAAHADRAEALRRQARQVDPDRCVEAVFELIALRESATEQFVSPKLIAALAREKWLTLFDENA